MRTVLVTEPGQGASVRWCLGENGGEELEGDRVHVTTSLSSRAGGVSDRTLATYCAHSKGASYFLRVTQLDRIWNGWRSQYVNEAGARDEPDEGSVFTQILASGLDDEVTHVIRRNAHTFVILNAFPYTSGHLMVLPYREVSNLEDLTVEETDELWPTVTAAVRAVRAAYTPGGVNVGINMGRAAGGSISEHLHVHVVPRWSGDGNFMTAVAEARTLPEPLSFSASKLRAAWPT